MHHEFHLRFRHNRLKTMLGKHRVRRSPWAGCSTNVYMESTMRTAYDQGFEVYTLTDCSATLGEEMQRTAIELDWPNVLETGKP